MARAGMPFTIEMLMTIAAGGALVIGEPEEAALVVFLFAVGELLEGVSAGKARDSIRALSKLVPKTARLEVGGKTREVAAETLQVGQVVQVRPGDRVPCDGEVIEGTSGVDESPVTGESVPSLKEPGAEVFAGSINAEALLRVRVTKAAEDNTIARIVRLVEEAESARAPTERFIDRFSRVYMPAVVGAAVLVAVVPPLAFGLAWGEWVYRALALLLIGCPCALVISVPASIASALSTGARNGLLMKGGAVIEAAARTTHVAFDKTGTLTHGRPRVTDVSVLSGSEDDLMALAAGVESGASHPLGQAICAEAERRGVDAAAATGGRALPGKGAEASIDGVTVCVGSPRLADERGALTDDLRTRVAALEAEGKTVVIVLRDDVPQGLIALRDEPRADAADAVAQLRNLGISSVMLTGDNPRTARAIAEGLGIEHRSELMPEDKVDGDPRPDDGRPGDDDRRRDQRRARARRRACRRRHGLGHRRGAGDGRRGDPAQPRDRRGGQDPPRPRDHGEHPPEHRHRARAEGGLPRDHRARDHRPLDRDPRRYRRHRAGHDERPAAAVLPAVRRVLNPRDASSQTADETRADHASATT